MKRLLAAALFIPLTVSATPKPHGHAMVVAIEHNAADAGLEVLRHGGNAVDAAVATGFALAVTLPQAGNLGGGGFMLIRMHDQTHFLDFRERAPAAATATMYQNSSGNLVPGLSTTGPLAIGVPGTVAGLVMARERYGRLTLAADMAPAIRLAARGFILPPEEADALRDKKLAQFPESRRIFQRDGRFYQPGELFQQPDLAATLTRIAAHPADLYTGPLAAQLAAALHAHGALITAADLAAYHPVERTPLTGTFSTHGHTYDILTSPPPSSGGVALLETLNILSGFDLAAAGPDRSPAQIHLIAEAFRRAYMDRADYLGDPDYTQIPLIPMLSAAYASAWRAGIDPLKPTPSAALERPTGFLPAPPAAAPDRHESPQTTHFSVVDSDGNAVATTYTLNLLFGSGVTADGLGFLLNDEMDDFSSKPGTPNAFGLIQGPANAIAPGHRPLSSMTPTIVTTHPSPGHPARLVLVLGSPGGSTIITTVANDLLSVLVNGLSVQAAADAPRFHHQYLPDRLEFEKAFDPATVAALKAAGYPISQANPADTHTAGIWGDSELIFRTPDGHLEGANDHRHHMGKVATY